MLERVLTLLIDNGFYFASQVNVFDQIKCFFCDCTFSCDIFSRNDLNEERVNNIHAHQSNCTFLISKIGAVEFQRLLRQGLHAVIPRFNETPADTQRSGARDPSG